MEKVLITKEMILLAEKKAKAMGVLKNSIEEGEGNIAGFVGEMVANHVLDSKITNTFDYDIITDDGIKIDVKTKRCTSAPKPNYDCSVSDSNPTQQCDYYCFVRVLEDYSCGWFLGVYKQSDYIAESTKMYKGQIDPANNFTVKSDCYNMPINKLRDKWEVLI
jgi:hypothetical protein